MRRPSGCGTRRRGNNCSHSRILAEATNGGRCVEDSGPGWIRIDASRLQVLTRSAGRKYVRKVKTQRIDFSLDPRSDCVEAVLNPKRLSPVKSALVGSSWETTQLDFKSQVSVLQSITCCLSGQLGNWVAYRSREIESLVVTQDHGIGAVSPNKVRESAIAALSPEVLEWIGGYAGHSIILGHHRVPVRTDINRRPCR
jgi:hypothetical protein